MKIARNFVVILILMFVAACGKGDVTEDNAKQDAIDAYADFTALLDSADVAPCLPPNTNVSCDCPGGGTFAVCASGQTVTMDNCISATGLYYSGTITSSDDWQTIDTSLTVFGHCSQVEGTATIGSCSGNLSMNCPEWGFDCQVIDDASNPGQCTLNC